MTKRIIVFDDECILCNKAVQFIIRKDVKERFKFASLQSAFGKNLVFKIGGDSTNLNSIILVEGEHYFLKSAAILKIIKALPGYSILFYFLNLFPSTVLDLGYTFTAKIRYKLFGRTDNCMLYHSNDFSKRIIK
ncbi:MAG: hypothetical protein RIT05_1029 [Bacteroidota bacterium]|jgi:predicted DCC family thiol-disulfide oxidoreductase YuxK